jgi:hypothetical protein
MKFFLPLQTSAFESFLEIKAQKGSSAVTNFFFAILQDIEAGMVLFERELFIPSDEEKGIFFVALFNFGKR